MRKILFKIIRLYGAIKFRELTINEITSLDIDCFNDGYNEGFKDATLIMTTSGDVIFDEQIKILSKRLDIFKDNIDNG
jgi:hypothetical protein